MRVKLKTYSLVGLCLILFFLLLLKNCELKNAKSRVEKSRVPDTVFIPKPYKVTEIKKEYIEKPVKVYVYLKDTTLRKTLEKSDVVIGIAYKRHNLFQKLDFIKIDRITPNGSIFSNNYELQPVREFTIDLKGNLQSKRKRYTGLKIIAGVVMLGTASYFIHQELKK